MPFLLQIIPQVYRRSALSKAVNASGDTKTSSASNEFLPPPPLPGIYPVDPQLTAATIINTEPGDATTSMEPHSMYNPLKLTAPTKRKPGRPRIQRCHPYGGYTPIETAMELKSFRKPITNADLVYNPYYPGPPSPKILTAATATTSICYPTYNYVTQMCDDDTHQHIDPSLRTCIDVNDNIGYTATPHARVKIQESLENPKIPLLDPKVGEGWEVLVSARQECDYKCQSVLGSCMLHRTCSCAKASYAHMHKWPPIEKAKKEGGTGWRKRIKAE